MRSIGKAKASVSPMPLPPSQMDIPSSRWYQNIYNLPLNKFEECLINNNLSVLTIGGFPTPVELNTAWSNIMEEYTTAIGDTEFQMYVELYREVELLKIDYSSIGLLISALRKNYSKYFCDELNILLRTDCKFNVKDLTSYFAELDKCERRAGAKKIQLDLKLIEFEAVKKKVTGGKEEKIDKNYFTSVLIILSKHNTYRITKDIFVNEYCEYLKQFTQYCEEMKKATKK